MKTPDMPGFLKEEIGAVHQCEVSFKITADPHARLLIFELGRPIAWFGLSCDVARQLAAGILEEAKKLEAAMEKGH